MMNFSYQKHYLRKFNDPVNIKNIVIQKQNFLLEISEIDFNDEKQKWETSYLFVIFITVFKLLNLFFCFIKKNLYETGNKSCMERRYGLRK